VPVGYGRIAAAVDVGETYLRQRLFARLIDSGLIEVMGRGLAGSVYRRRYDSDVLASVSARVGKGRAPRRFPEWVDQRLWTFGEKTFRQLVKRSGGEERAAEVLNTIAYNETHGPASSRVRNRHAVLTAYLSGQITEVFPNDTGYETLAMRRERVKLELARREQQLAEESLEAQRQAERVKEATANGDEMTGSFAHGGWVMPEGRLFLRRVAPAVPARPGRPARHRHVGRVLVGLRGQDRGQAVAASGARLSPRSGGT
jgi:hypothetical protein